MKSAVLFSLLMLCFESRALVQQQWSFDLDVPPGRSSFWQIDDLGNACRLQGSFEVLELRRDRKWSPAFQISLERDGKGISLSFVQEGGKGALLARIDALERGERRAGRIIENWKIDRGKPFVLSLDWSVKDVLVISYDTREMGRFELPIWPKTVIVSASTGEWKGQGLMLQGCV